MEIANRKMTINLYKSFADLGFEKLKFNVGREDVANATKLAYQKNATRFFKAFDSKW